MQSWFYRWDSKNVLVGGVDEITDFSFEITSRFGLFRKISGLISIYSTQAQRARLPAKGQLFFLINSEASPEDYAILQSVTTFYKPIDHKETETNIQLFLAEQSISIDQIDIVLCGRMETSRETKCHHYLNKRYSDRHRLFILNIFVWVSN